MANKKGSLYGKRQRTISFGTNATFGREPLATKRLASTGLRRDNGFSKVAIPWMLSHTLQMGVLCRIKTNVQADRV